MIEILLKDGRIIPLEADIYTIGRGSQSSIKVLENSVSRIHCTILIESDAIYIIDGDYQTGKTSSNGIAINDRNRLNSLLGHELKHGDEVLLLPIFSFKIFKKEDIKDDPDSTLL